jgi:hypothetical protein
MSEPMPEPNTETYNGKPWQWPYGDVPEQGM